MRAMTVVPGEPGTAAVDEVADPARESGGLLVRGLLVGVSELGELGVLLEPASVLAKAWEQVDRISQRAFFLGQRALVTGVGPIGLPACLLGVQRGYTRRVPLARWTEALDREPDDIKVVVELTG